MHNNGCGWPATGLDLRFNDGSTRGSGRRRSKLHYFRLQRHHFEEVINAGTFGRGNRGHNCFSTPILWRQVVFLQLLFHFVNVGRGKIDFIYRDHDFDMGRSFGVVNSLDRLWHNAVIGGDDQHDDVSHIGPTRPHGRECRVARRVDEGDPRSFVIDAVGANMLRDPASFARRNARLPNRVHQ